MSALDNRRWSLRSTPGPGASDWQRFFRRELIARRIRFFLLGEAAAFLVAALVHFGVLMGGYEHREAGTAESVIALVLLLGLGVNWVLPAWTRPAGLASQGFALLGTLVGLFTIAVGIGPRTVPDIVYHVGILAVLVWGLAVTVRTPTK